MNTPTRVGGMRVAAPRRATAKVRMIDDTSIALAGALGPYIVLGWLPNRVMTGIWE